MKYEILPFVTWVERKGIMLHEIKSGRERKVPYDLSKHVKSTKKKTVSYRKHTGDFKRLGCASRRNVSVFSLYKVNLKILEMKIYRAAERTAIVSG